MYKNGLKFSNKKKKTILRSEINPCSNSRALPGFCVANNGNVLVGILQRIAGILAMETDFLHLLLRHIIQGHHERVFRGWFVCLVRFLLAKPGA